ncbi:hypothetical protein ACFSC3_08125 [Sphingomonas floccifaciens]|uniref:Hemerythrin-like domain-containing protein n=1 Tax=Sphingomonas floccifaciens TaxID=1844115 RepID=A0ABW4NCK9_9SPHN
MASAAIAAGKEKHTMKHNRLEGSVVAFTRRWHVIQEVDLVRLIGEHRRRAALCESVEAVADALPLLPDPAVAEMLCRELDDMVAGNERDELPFLEAMLVDGHDDPLAAALLDQVRIRCVDDAAKAADVIRALRAPLRTRRPLHADALGYLLRGFIEDCRRAIGFEQLTILAVAGHRLTPDARALLIDCLTPGPA